MNIMPVQEIKRRGISAVDEALENGAVHIIKNNKPQYVVITEARYQELIESEFESYTVRVKASLEDVKSGKVKKGSASDLIKELGLDK